MASATRTRVNVASAKYAAYVAAALGFGATAFILITALNRGGTSRCSFDEFRNAFKADGDMTCIEKFWTAERENFGLIFGFDVLEGLGALLTIPAIFTLAEMYGWHFTESKIMATAFAISLFTNFLEFAIRAGERSVSDWLAGPSWGLQGDQLRGLTLSYIQQQGAFTWVFAFDELLLGIALIAAAVLGLARRPGVLPAWHSWLSVVAGILAVVNFGLELGRLGSWRTLSIIGGISIAVVGFILLPIWLVTVGCYLEVFAPEDGRGAPLMDDDEDSRRAGGLAAGDVALDAEPGSV